jgi:hypothetical protein
MKSFRTVVGSEVRFIVPPDSPCPCGSKKPASRCCVTAKGFHKLRTATTPAPPRTGYSLSSCYAAPLADCSSKRSREHGISESLLRYLGAGSKIKVAGLPWLGEKERILSSDALASRILCERHNSALSGLDAIAVSLFEAFDEQNAVGSGKQLLHVFNGHDLERWLLKILCAEACSKSFPIEGNLDLSIPKYWLEILFGQTGFPNHQGLYVCRSRGHRFDGPHGLQFRAIAGRGRLTGMGTWVCGYELILSMSGFQSRKFDGREFVYRPFEFYTMGRDFEKSLILCWDDAADLGTISCTIDGT